MHHLARTRLTLAAIALTLVPALAACGSGEGADTGLPAAQGQKSTDKSAEKKVDPKDAADAQEKYNECLLKQGVTQDANGSFTADQDVFQAAEEACKDLMADLPVQEISPEAEKKFQDSFLALAKCMRGLGYDYPDPDPNNPGTTFTPKPGLSNEQIQQDQAHCADEAGLGGGMTSSSSSAQ